MAAWLVVCGHVRNMLLTDMSELHGAGWAIKAFYFFTGFGHQSVILFFVISGFLVGGMTLERWRAQPPDPGAYFIARFSRIYTVLIPALIVGWLFDTAGALWFEPSRLYANALTEYKINSLPDHVLIRTDWLTFSGNLLNLQGVAVPTLGSNGPLWSLANEWWYYCLFAFVAMALKSRVHRTGFALASLAIAALLPTQMLIWGAIWAMGLGTHAWIRANVKKPSCPIAAVLFLAAMAWTRLHHAQSGMALEFLADAVVAATFCLLLASLSTMRRPLPWAKFHHWAAEFSFSTYLFHFPAMVFAAAALGQNGLIQLKGQPTGYQLSVYGAMVLALLAFSLLAYQLFEKHTAEIKRALSRHTRSATGSISLDDGRTSI